MSSGQHGGPAFDSNDERSIGSRRGAGSGSGLEHTPPGVSVQAAIDAGRPESAQSGCRQSFKRRRGGFSHLLVSRRTRAGSRLDGIRGQMRAIERRSAEDPHGRPALTPGCDQTLVDSARPGGPRLSDRIACAEAGPRPSAPRPKPPSRLQRGRRFASQPGDFLDIGRQKPRHASDRDGGYGPSTPRTVDLCAQAWLGLRNACHPRYFRLAKDARPLALDCGHRQHQCKPISIRLNKSSRGGREGRREEIEGEGGRKKGGGRGRGRPNGGQMIRADGRLSSM